jgi:hypothetical protein
MQTGSDIVFSSSGSRLVRASSTGRGGGGGGGGSSSSSHYEQAELCFKAVLDLGALAFFWNSSIASTPPAQAPCFHERQYPVVIYNWAWPTHWLCQPGLAASMVNALAVMLMLRPMRAVQAKSRQGAGLACDADIIACTQHKITLHIMGS